MVMIRLDMAELEAKLGEAAADVALQFANELVNQLKVESPTGATGSLQESFQIFRRSDGVIFLGTRIPYAFDVWKGQPPHTPDFDAIEVWARRKLGDESAAGPVFRKIQREGTEANPYVERAVDNAVRGFSL